MKAFEIGLALVKMAGSSNPAQPVKQSLPTGHPEAQRFAPYLNQGGGMPAAHQAGDVQRHAQPWPGYINTGDKGAPQQTAGMVAMDKSPDTGEMGSAGGDMTVTKSAAFWAGVDTMLDDDE